MICKIISAIIASFFREWPWPSSSSVAFVARCLANPNVLKFLREVLETDQRNLPWLCRHFWQLLNLIRLNYEIRNLNGFNSIVNMSHTEKAKFRVCLQIPVLSQYCSCITNIQMKRYCLQHHNQLHQATSQVDLLLRIDLTVCHIWACFDTGIYMSL